MQWNFGSILDYISDLISVGQTLDDNTKTYLKNLINSAVGDCYITFPVEELKLPDHYVRTAADYSTGTVAVTNGSKAVTGTTTVWTYKMIGRKIRIADEKVLYKIDDIDTAAQTLTLDRTYNGTTDTDATYNILENSFDLPVDFLWIKGAFDPTANYKPLDEIPWDEIEELDPGLTHTGTPEKYSKIGNKRYREPLYPTNYAADASTTTTEVIEASLKADEDDYYVDWLLVNVTRGKTAKVIDYVASTTTLTLEEAITGQTAADAFYLQKDQPQITFYRRPSTAKDILVKGYKRGPQLFNLYDIPLLGEDFRDLIAAKVLTIWFGKDELANKWADVAAAQEETLLSKYSRKIDKRQREGMYQKTGREISFNVQE